ncbi:unnamed protein product [Cuscuta epithymum]|uniref:Uncharacterized protein n=1 Tax=Cuscuta epithymum TaxID=186058 RepID=A0AAV0D9I7_9ASTE|nr:unnamed protein product [Cuscuta epithymum]
MSIERFRHSLLVVILTIYKQEKSLEERMGRLQIWDLDFFEGGCLSLLAINFPRPEQFVINSSLFLVEKNKKNIHEIDREKGGQYGVGNDDQTQLPCRFQPWIGENQT